MKKCNVNFESKYIFVDGVGVHVNEYVNGPRFIGFCKNGHELILVNGKIRTPHFRHKHTEDVGGNPMTKWHCEWQGNFPHTEVYFNKKSESDEQIKNRRADVHIPEHSFVVEFQHSVIEKKEVDEREHDYALHKQEVLWVIDGNNGIRVYKLKDRRIFLEFTELWKFQSFHKNAYIDIDGQIYAFSPNHVKSGMIDTGPPIAKNDFMKAIKDGKKPTYASDIPQCTLTIKQQGAGNGKTYGIIRLIEDENYAHYDTFVYLTKQHSAVYVIFSEMKAQLFANIEFGKFKMEGKKYVVEFRHINQSSWRKIIIGTIDSFVYSFGGNRGGVDKFSAMVESLIEDEIIPNQLKYAGGVKLNKKLLLVGDEMQDLPTSYAKAIIRIMRDFYVNFYAVGDRLQSISIENNTFTYLCETEKQGLPYTVIDCKPASNVCRRFTEQIPFVNSMIEFKKFNLPPIQQTKKGGGGFHIFSGLAIFPRDGPDKINKEVDEIMKYYKKEVNENKRRPNDFLIVTPFVKQNPLVEAVHQHIREFWEKKEGDEYKCYSVFHRSQEGTSIDLSESKDATRIVSIHSSKGDGRAVVFAIGVKESALRIYSDDKGNLVYESLLHVALTRMKQMLYFRVEPNHDDIHERVSKNTNLNDDLPPMINVSRKVKLSDLMKVCQNDTYARLNESLVLEEKNVEVTKEKMIIDMKHHMIRYGTMIVQSFIKVMQHQKGLQFISEGNEVKRQFYAILTDISEARIIKCANRREYWRKLTCKLTDNNNDVPFYTYTSKGGEYRYHKETIFNIIKKVQAYFKKLLSGKVPDDVLTYEDYIVIYFLREQIKQRHYSLFPISDLYDIFDLIYKKTDDEKEMYKKMHYDELRLIDNLWDEIFKTNGEMNVLYDYPVELSGGNDIRVKTKYTFIAYNENTILNIIIKPQFNSLNFNEVLIENIFQTHIIECSDGKKYHIEEKQRVKSCVLSLDHEKPYYINPNNTQCVRAELSVLLKRHFVRHNNEIVRWYKYQKNKSNKHRHIVKEFNKLEEVNQNIPKYVSDAIYSKSGEDFECQLNSKMEDAIDEFGEESDSES